jgi:cytoplasmic iron level regulating protein YaaA (DUF328/UPF0246 family)
MKILVSPAKSLNYERPLPHAHCSQPVFAEQAQQLNESLRLKKPAELQKLMGISQKLADLNWTRNQAFSFPFTSENARPAVYAFDGDVYSGLDAYSINEKNWDTLNDSLRILSGLYGILKPFDLMQPYRLEMGTAFGTNGSKNLYEFWKSTLTNQLNKELQKDELVVNLASKEYASAVDLTSLKAEVVSPVFKDFKNGQLKIISFFAKKARGLMARYLIDSNAQDTSDLLGFAENGYAYSAEHTTHKSAPVFIR